MLIASTRSCFEQIRTFRVSSIRRSVLRETNTGGNQSIWKREDTKGVRWVGVSVSSQSFTFSCVKSAFLTCSWMSGAWRGKSEAKQQKQPEQNTTTLIRHQWHAMPSITITLVEKQTNKNQNKKLFGTTKLQNETGACKTDIGWHHLHALLLIWDRNFILQYMVF